jgi:hypothetical protein
MAQVPICRPVVAEARVRSQVSLCDICGGQSATGRGLVARSSGFNFQYHATAIFIFNLELLLLAGETGQAWEPSK